MSVAAYEIVKEYVFHYEWLYYPVRGRVIRAPDEGTRDTCFMWEISHHFQPHPGVEVYYPSKVSAGSAQDAQRLLLHYARSFPEGAQVQVNDRY